MLSAFIVPKLLNNQNLTEERYNTIARESIMIVQAAYTQYRMQNNIPANFNMNDLRPYLHYTRRITSGSYDDVYGLDRNWNCSGGNSYHQCYRLSNGALLIMHGTAATFPDAEANSYIYFWIDPDGKKNAGGVTQSTGKAMYFQLYYGGQIREQSNCVNPSFSNDGGFIRECRPGWYTSNTPPWWKF